MKLRYLTAGESHGKGLTGIIEGIPAGVEILDEYLKFHMKRRKMGYGRGFRQKIEDDAVEIVGGVRHGLTMGSPVALIVWNKDYKNWEDIMQAEPHPGGEVRREVHVPRPGHADYLGGVKYKHGDMRNVLERSSARETAMRVAIGTVCRKFLEELGIFIGSRMIQIGEGIDEDALDVSVRELNAATDESPVRCLNEAASEKMVASIDAAKKRGDTLGGVFEVYAEGMPVGTGSYVQWDRRLEGKIAHQILSMNAIKGVEMGLGFEHGRVFGSEAHDEFYPGEKDPKRLSYKTNRAGGVTGGMTTGQPIITRVAMKPIATLMKPLNSVDMKTGKAVKAHVERSDTCAAPAAAVICESLIALALAEAVLDKFGGDSMEEIRPRVEAWRNETEN